MSHGHAEYMTESHLNFKCRVRCPQTPYTLRSSPPKSRRRRSYLRTDPLEGFTDSVTCPNDHWREGASLDRRPNGRAVPPLPRQTSPSSDFTTKPPRGRTSLPPEHHPVHVVASRSLSQRILVSKSKTFELLEVPGFPNITVTLSTVNGTRSVIPHANLCIASRSDHVTQNTMRITAMAGIPIEPIQKLNFKDAVVAPASPAFTATRRYPATATICSMRSTWPVSPSLTDTSLVCTSKRRLRIFLQESIDQRSQSYIRPIFAHPVSDIISYEDMLAYINNARRIGATNKNVPTSDNGLCRMDCALRTQLAQLAIAINVESRKYDSVYVEYEQVRRTMDDRKVTLAEFVPVM
ncbi:hypothetical protein B0H11DRAFT_1945310 [Mycena galericulata]|nr:hypothetical protein B0H11DRAFT_1945310 [Mycena galericulata]